MTSSGKRSPPAEAGATTHGIPQRIEGLTRRDWDVRGCPRSSTEDVARFRLRIKASERKVAATGVEVFIESVVETAADPIRALLPAGGQPLNVSHSDRTEQTVPPGASRFVDLVELRRPLGSHTAATLLLAGEPVELSLGKTYHLAIDIAGANLRSQRVACEVTWNAEFDPHGFPDEALKVVAPAST